MNTGRPHAILCHDHQLLPCSAFESLPWEVQTITLAKGAPLPELPTDSVDIFALLVDASTGISDTMISAWNFYQERQFSRLMLVQGIDADGFDFDDIVLIGNRVLEPFATPFLVLHNEDGAPIGLIELESGLVLDYSSPELLVSSADQELLELVGDFQDEYRTNFLDLGDSAFASGVLAVALPISESNGLGVREVTSYLQLLTKR